MIGEHKLVQDKFYVMALKHYQAEGGDGYYSFKTAKYLIGPQQGIYL
jgi:hypothetical protein